jgi:hypothetical protein
MDTIVLELGGKSFKLVFGLKLFRLLGRKWDLPGIDEVVQKIAILDAADKKLTFAQIDVLEMILVTAIECAGETINVFEFDIIDEFFKSPKALDVFKNVLVNSMPNSKSIEPGENEGK